MAADRLLGGARAPLVAWEAISADEPTEIYARAEWYAERPEPERRWSGVLREREPPGGPAGRAALRYALELEGRSLDVYAARLESMLADFVGRPVVADGKLVDLTGEGFGRELWLAWIRLAPAGPQP